VEIVYTVGYAGRTIPGLAALLKSYGVTHVVDVRSVPYSKAFPDYVRESLEKTIPEQGLKYVYLGTELGGMTDQHDPVAFERGIRQVSRASERHSLCLMCSENRPQDCHRTRLIAPALIAEGIEVLHINEKGELLSQEQAVARREPEQFDLFDAD